MSQSVAARRPVSRKASRRTDPDLSYTAEASIHVRRDEIDAQGIQERGIRVELTVDCVAGTDYSHLTDICHLRVSIDQGSDLREEDEHLWQLLSARELYAFQRTLNVVIGDAQRRKLLPMEA